MATFHPFPRLPAELRIMIWKVAVADADKKAIIKCKIVANMLLPTVECTVFSHTLAQACFESRSLVRPLRRLNLIASDQQIFERNVTTVHVCSHYLGLVGTSAVARGIKTITVEDASPLPPNILHFIRRKFPSLTSCTLRGDPEDLERLCAALAERRRHGLAGTALLCDPDTFDLENSNTTLVLKWNKAFGILWSMGSQPYVLVEQMRTGSLPYSLVAWPSSTPSL